MGRAQKKEVQTEAARGVPRFSELKWEFLMTSREALNPGKQTEWSDTKPKAWARLAQEKRQQAKEVKHKWKGIQVHFLEELTLFETCLGVPDFKKPQAKWRVKLAALQCFPEMGSIRWPAPWQLRYEKARNVGCSWECCPPISRSHMHLRPAQKKWVSRAP